MKQGQPQHNGMPMPNPSIEDVHNNPTYNSLHDVPGPIHSPLPPSYHTSAVEAKHTIPPSANSYELSSQQPVPPQMNPHHQQANYPSYPEPTHPTDPRSMRPAGQEQHHYQQQQQQQPGAKQTLFVNPTPVHSLRAYPAVTTCPRCNYTGMTTVRKESGSKTHLWAAIACFCCCLGCIPYLFDDLKDSHHFCEGCGSHLTTWKD